MKRLWVTIVILAMILGVAGLTGCAKKEVKAPAEEELEEEAEEGVEEEVEETETPMEEEGEESEGFEEME